MFTNDVTLSRLCPESQIPDVAHNKHWTEFIISLPHQIFQITWLTLNGGSHLNPMITWQRLPCDFCSCTL